MEILVIYIVASLVAGTLLSCGIAMVFDEKSKTWLGVLSFVAGLVIVLGMILHLSIIRSAHEKIMILKEKPTVTEVTTIRDTDTTTTYFVRYTN